MKIGQIVREAQAMPPWRAFAAKLEQKDFEIFWQAPVFHAMQRDSDQKNSLSTRLAEVWSRLWRKASGRSRPPGAKASLMSTGDALASAPHPVTFGVATGSETVLIAHNHVVFISGPDGPCDVGRDPAIEIKSAQVLASALSGYFNEYDGFRVVCLASPRLERDEVRMYCGRGIFAPAAGEAPIGWLRYWRDMKDAERPGVRPQEPMLGETLSDGRKARPAGFYSGQKALSFASEPGALPAWLDFGLPGRQPNLALTLEPHALGGEKSANFIALKHTSGELGLDCDPIPQESLPDGIDQSWKINFTGAEIDMPEARLDLCLDSRVGRFYMRPPVSRPYAAITAIWLDKACFGPACRRVWFNVDHNGLLISSAMRPVRASIVYEFRAKRLRLYNWANFDYGSNLGFQATHFEQGLRISRHDGSPFGYLALPEEAARVVFSAEFANSSTYALDWLNLAGAVEAKEQAGRKPLAHHLADCGLAATIPSQRELKAAPEGRVETVVGPLILEAKADQAFWRKGG